MCDNPAGEGKIIPTLLLEAPPSADENGFYNDALDLICGVFNHNARTSEKCSQLKGLLRVVGLKVLVIDELHNIATGPGPKQQHFLTVLKYLSNELDISILCAGTDEAQGAMAWDKQIESRFEVIQLPLWRANEDFLRLLDSFESRLPLRRPSHLASEELSTLLLALGKGTFSRILALVTAAAVRAIRSGKERITRQMITGLDDTPGSDSLKRAG